MTCGIYCLTSPSSKKYIGQSLDIEKRWQDYRCYSCSGQRRLLSALRKYGVENFVFEIIEICIQDKLNEREVYYISLYETMTKGYNLTSGGESYIRSPETKARMSASMKGRKFSETTRAKLSIAHTGRRQSEETRAKKRVSAGKRILSNEYRDACSERALRPENIARLKASLKATYEYLVVDPTGIQYVTTNLRQFCKDHNLTETRLRKVIKGQILTAKGWTASVLRELEGAALAKANSVKAKISPRIFRHDESTKQKLREKSLGKIRSSEAERRRLETLQKKKLL